MALGLDLSQSDAKIARANEHLDALNREIDTVVQERNPYTASLKFNKDSGSYSVMLRSSDFKEPRIGVILGDFIHNLRSALDYIVTALVKASPGVELAKSHQFPIMETLAEYTRNAPRVLLGIVHGKDIIECLQPFNRQKDPRLDPLFFINLFSNSDKHRVISDYWPVLGPIANSKISPKEGIIDWEQFPPPMQWFPNDEREILRIRYSAPVPAKVDFNCDVSVDIRIGAAGFGKHKKPLAYPRIFPNDARDHVAMIVDTFKAL